MLEDLWCYGLSFLPISLESFLHCTLDFRSRECLRGCKRDHYLYPPILWKLVCKKKFLVYFFPTNWIYQPRLQYKGRILLKRFNIFLSGLPINMASTVWPCYPRCTPYIIKTSLLLATQTWALYCLDNFKCMRYSIWRPSKNQYSKKNACCKNPIW